MAERIVERSAISMYEQDQAKYSIVVNRRRAIPAVQDGLKPVQRRTVYAAYKDRLIKPSAKDKSASIVGTTMKDFHPHGDCLRGNTVLKLLNGEYKTIEQLYLEGNSVEILSVHPKSGKIIPAVAHSFRVGQYTNKIYHIQFSNGYEIQCTGNHPFMLPNLQWIKAEDIKPYTRLYCSHITDNRKDGRESIDNKLIQDIVYEFYYGIIPDGFNKHHIDFNTKNNTKNNLKCLSDEDHRIIHESNLREMFLDGLEKGRQSMFYEDGEIKTKTQRKNSILMKNYNENQAIIRFKKYINLLIENGIEVTEENYESLRPNVYNLPLISKIIERHPEYGNSFNELVNCEIPNMSDLYIDKKSQYKNPIYFDEDQNISPKYISIPYTCKCIIDNIIDNNLPFTSENYFNLCNLTSIDENKVLLYMELYKFSFPFITNIFIEDTNNEPMYDFTVDGYENMLFPVGNTIGSFAEQYIGNYTPMICVHNSSIYEAIATLVAWYKTKYPIFYGKGNWGNVSGAGPAASRYTECALSNFGYDIFVDELAQSNNIVDWVETYKRNGNKEPEYLPAKVPNLLINGSFGIGVGMSINVPSHNLGEVLDETVKLIKNNNHKVVLIPDLSQDCELIDADWKTISETGRGSFKVRGKIITEQDKKGNYRLRIVSLPDQVSCNQVYDKILSMIGDKQLPMIKDIYNSLTKDEKPDIIIDLRPGADPGYVKQAIYAKTQVQQTISVNFEAVSMNGIDLKRFSYKEYLLDFIDQRMSIKFRLYCNKLQQVMTRHLQVDAFVKVLQSKEFDKIMNMIRKYNGTDDLPIVEFMIKNCNITDIQAKFILTRTLPQLSKGHLQGYINERKELQSKIDTYMKFVTDDGSLIKEEIVEELKVIKAKYNTPRLCNVISSAEENDIPKGTFKVVITERNYIRKIPDVDKVGIVRKDNPKFILKVDNAESILIFDNKGKVFSLPVHKIPITDRAGAGTDIRILVKNLTSDITAVFYEPIFDTISKSSLKHYLAVLTKSNTIKKLDIEDFLNVSPSGLLYSKIRPEDEVVGVALVPHNLDIAICSGHKVLRCKFKDVPLYKRNAAGAKAMGTLDPINGLSVLYPDAKEVVVVTKNGKFNRFAIDMLSCLSRGRKGSTVIKLDSNDEILNIFACNSTDKIRLLTSEGIEEVLVENIKMKSSIAAGTKMIQSKGVIVRADVTR